MIQNNIVMIKIWYADETSPSVMRDEEEPISCKSEDEAFKKIVEYISDEAREACCMEEEPVQVTLYPPNYPCKHQAILRYCSDNSYCYYDIVRGKYESVVL